MFASEGGLLSPTAEGRLAGWPPARATGVGVGASGQKKGFWITRVSGCGGGLEYLVCPSRARGEAAARG